MIGVSHHFFSSRMNSQNSAKRLIGEIRKGSYIAVVTTTLSFAGGAPLIMAYGVWGAAMTQVGVALVAFVLIGGTIRAELSRLDTAAVPGRGEVTR